MSVKRTIQYGIAICVDGQESIIPCVSEIEALEKLDLHENTIPLFGETIKARLVKRTTIITVENSDWL